MGKKSNIKGGNKHKKYAKEREQVIRLNIFELDKSEDQEFAFVDRVLGNKRFGLICYDKKKRIGLVRASKRNMSKRKNWVSPCSLVLISLRTFTTVDEKCDIIKLYNNDEVNFLLKHKKIHSNFAKSGSFIRETDTTSDAYSFIEDSTKPINKKKVARNYDDVYMISDDEEGEADEYNYQETRQSKQAKKGDIDIENI